MTFPERFEQLCKEKHLAPSAVGAILGFSRNTVSLWRHETTLPRGNSLQKLSAFFDVSTDYLLGKSDLRNPEKDFSQTDKLKIAVFGTDTIPPDAWMEFERAVTHLKRKYNIPTNP